ncbi:MAG: hypothetical protein FWD63_02485 [Propionibacteriaceae bacterium]|nr:hypothetical protein [Propionibacteriaceae bacterium]
MADNSSKRAAFRIAAILGVVVLVAGAIMFLLASRQVTMASYDTTMTSVSVPGAAQADDGSWSATAPGGDVTFGGTGTTGNAVTASATTTATDAVIPDICSTTVGSDGTWSCSGTLDAGDYTVTIAVDPNSPLSLPLGVAGLIIVVIGAVIAIAGGFGLVVTGGQPIGLLSLLLIPVGVALDFALAWVNNTLKLPLFLDSVGHILAGMLGGPVIGGITGFLGVLTNSAFQPAAIVWCFQGATIGVVVGLLAQAGMFKNWRRAIISGLIVIATSATMSSILSLVIFGGIDGYTISFVRAALTNMGWSMTSAVVVTSVIVELIDKTISVGLPFLVIVGMSNRLLNQFVTGPKLRELKTETIAQAEANDNVTPADLGSDGYGSYADK